MHGVDSILPIECKIPSLKLVVEHFLETSELEEHLVRLEQLDEHCRDALVALEVNNRRVKAQYVSLSILGSLLKVTWSSCMTKLVNC